MVINWKTCPINDFDSTKEASWCTECNTKTSALNKVPFSEKIKKKHQNCYFFRNAHFWGFFLIFSDKVLYKELWFFLLHSVHHDASSELSESTIRQFPWFVTISGDPFALGGSERYTQGKDRSKMVSTVFFMDLMAFPMLIHIRPKTFPRISI